MRPDGTLEEWDEIYLPNYSQVAIQINPNTGRPYRQRRYRGARIVDLYVMIHEAMKAYQSHFVKTGSFRGLFQFARYMERGDKISNVTTSDVYTVEDLITTPEGEFLGEVILSGDVDPEESHRLRLDDQNLIVFSHDSPHSEVPSQGHDLGTERTDKPDPWTDTIGAHQIRQEPGTRGKKPFAPDRQALPLLREHNVDDLVDPGVGIDICGWWFDHIIQFDIWGRDNRRVDGDVDLQGYGDPGLVRWFQDFMSRHRWVFLWNGINQILEWQGTEDKPVARYRNDMVHRPLLYYVRTERISGARRRRIEHMDILVNIGAPWEPTEGTGCPLPTGEISTVVNDLGLYANLGG